MGESPLSSVSGNTCRLRSIMVTFTQVSLTVCLLSGCSLSNDLNREGRNLLGTFPFNAQEGELHQHHGDHHVHHQGAGHHETSSLSGRANRQGDAGADVSFDAVAGSSPGSDGKRCIDKVEMVQETEYDEVVQCDHTYDRRCHTSYVTQYESQQEEECEENFRKSCFIEYEKIAFNETVQICREPLIKDCDVQGEEICRTEYESECWTKQEF